MNLQEAIAAIRSLDLPQPRRVELTRQLATTSSARRWFLIVVGARQEVARNALANRSAIEKAYEDQRQRLALIGAQTPRRAPTKLTDEDRSHARKMRADGATLRKIPERFGVAESTVFRALESAPEAMPVIPAKKLKAWTPNELTDDDERHGTNSGYANFGCRCTECVTARKEYTRMRKANPKPRAKTAVHGSESKYARGCRCTECKAAKATANRRRKLSS